MTGLQESTLTTDLDLMTPEERMDAIAGILARGVLRLIEKQAREAREDKAFGDELAAEVANLPGGRS